MQLFYEIIQVALGRKKRLDKSPTSEEWNRLFEESQKQAVVGVSFAALERLSEEGQRPPLEILYRWIGQNEQIRQRNGIINKRCSEVSLLFSKAGFVNCILKGQGNAKMYPQAISRTPGDIDIWVLGKREDIKNFVRKRCPLSYEQEIHIDFPIFDDVPVEVHFKPGTLLGPKYNRRFQQYCREYSLEFDSKVADDGFNVPSVEFNAVHQMSHIMIHFFIEGIGLRHFVDYYYVLTNTDFSNRKEVIITLRYLGLEKFAKGVMWIEQYCLGLEDKYLLFEPSEKIGRVILKEMEEGGNFGHHDERYSLRGEGVLARGLADGWRLIRLARVFPSESMWKLVDKVENQKWKLKNGHRLC